MPHSTHVIQFSVLQPVGLRLAKRNVVCTCARGPCASVAGVHLRAGHSSILPLKTKGVDSAP